MSKQNEQEQRLHAKLGGSSAYRWVPCPGSVFLLDKCPKEESSGSANEGTRKHDFCEKRVKAFLQYKLDGTHQVLEELSPEDEAYANEYVQTIWTKCLEHSITGKGFGVEDYFEIDKALHMGGYIDFWCVFINDKGLRQLNVLDLKTGFHYVPAKKNFQMLFYAAAVRAFLREHGKDIDVVKMCIYQPKTEDEPYRCWSCTAKQLSVYEKKFFDAARQIFVKRKPKFKTGDHCTYCPALALCPKYCKELESNTSLKVIDVDKIKLPEVESLSDDQIRRICLNGSDIEKYIKACRAYVINNHLNGRKISGLKVIEGKGRRKFISDVNKVGKGLEALGFDPWVKGLCTIGDAEKVLGSESIAPFITYTDASPIIVPEEDPRESISTLVEKLD